MFFRKVLPGTIHQTLYGPEVGFVSHFCALCNPVAQIEIWQAQPAAQLHLPHDVVGAESSLRQALVLSDGSLSILVSRPISATFLALTIVSLILPTIILRRKGELEAAHKLLQDGLMSHSRNPYFLNQLGVYSREMGQFKKAQASYESAIRIDANYAKAHYNLAVLADLYLHDAALALQEFQTYQTLLPEPDAKVAGWIKEIERRKAP